MQSAGWQPLNDFVRQHPELRPGAPMRVGQPVGPYRREWVLGRLRRSGEIKVRGYRNLAAKPELLPPCEYSGFILRWQSDRIEHVHSGAVYYGVSIQRQKPRPSAGNAAPPASGGGVVHFGNAPIGLPDLSRRSPGAPKVPPRLGKFEFLWSTHFDPHISLLLADPVRCSSALRDGESFEGYAYRYARAHVRHKENDKRKPTRPAVRKHLGRIAPDWKKTSATIPPPTR